MELKKQFRIIYTGVIMLLAILCVLAILMFQSYAKFEKSNRIRYDSFRIADELRQTSYDLTRFCRTYVLTGDSIWEKKYWQVLDIRNGVKPRPDGRTIALRDSMINLGFLKSEFDKLNEAEDNSNELVWTETVAFNAMKGLFDDGTGKFTVKKAPDLAFARRIMFDDKYHADKTKIMNPIDDFIDLLNIRTHHVVAQHSSRSIRLLASIIGLIILIGGISIISYFKIKNKIIKQLEKLKLAKEKIEINEDKLKKQQYYLTKAQEIGSIGTWELDLLKNELIWTEQNYINFGVPLGTALTYEIFLDCVHPDDREYVNTEWMAAIEGKPYDIEHRLNVNGEIRWVREKADVEFDKKGKAVKAIGFTQDITERKEVEKELAKHRAHLEIANKELEAFSYSVSHDLRAPLRAIDGFTQILIEDYASKLDEQGKRLGSTIHYNAKKMGKLIDDLLAFSRLGRAAMTITKIDMKNMVNAIYQEATSAKERKRIKLSLIDLPQIEGDTNLMRQVWMNLIKNAVKFSSQRKQAVISVTSKGEKNKVTYCIKDNGAGFNIKYVDKLFGVFQRLHSEEDFKGTGIGLSLVKRIIKRHDGNVWAESKVDKGASFYFSLPKKQK